jgi:hypothetical protein
LTKKKSKTPHITIGFRTSNNSSGSFNALEADLKLLGLPPNSIDVANYSFHVRGNAYEVPNIARRDHRCIGSIDLCIPMQNEEKYETLHIFYLDETMHDGVIHWNHEVWSRKNKEDFRPLPKDKTKYHKIPDADAIELWACDDKGKKDSKVVQKPKG